MLPLVAKACMALLGVAAAACADGFCAPDVGDEASLLVLHKEQHSTTGKGGLDIGSSRRRRRRRRRRRPPSPPPPPDYYMTCTGGTLPYQVCADADPQRRCRFLKSFGQANGDTLLNGLKQQQECAAAAADPECCYTPEASMKFLGPYTDGYAEDGGTHASFIFTTGGIPGTPSYAVQSNRTLIAEYYGRFVGANSIGFDLVAPLETINASWSLANDNCFNEIGPTKPAGFTVFGFKSSTFAYGVGTVILGRSGRILRQIAVGDGVLDQSKAPVPIHPIPEHVMGAGMVSSAFRAYWKAFWSGDAAKVASFYTTDAKILLYNNLNKQDFQYKAVNGAKQIEAFMENLIDHFGMKALADHRTWIQTAEEADGETPGNTFSAYTIGTHNVGNTLVFTSCGKIFAHGMVGALGGSIE